MSPSRSRFLVRFTAIFALCLFAGDLVADLCDAARRHTETISCDCQNDPDSCPNCVCALHSGTILASEPVTLSEPAVSEGAVFANLNERAPRGEPLAIDHPPRLV